MKNPLPIRLLVLLAMLLLPDLLPAQTTFTVTVQPKTAAHPNYGVSGSMGYAIDGVEGKELTLQRGVRYRFQMQNVPVTYPFAITTGSRGDTVFYNGVEGIFVSGNGALYFTPDSTAPDVLWYTSSSHHHPDMGWKINITGTAAAPDASALSAESLLSEPWPHPASGNTSLRLTVARPQTVRLSLYDASGRMIALLHDGLVTGEQIVSFDASALSPGIYTCVAIAGPRIISKPMVVGT